MLEPEQLESVKEQLLKQIEQMPEDQRGEWKEQIENASPEQIEALLKQSGGDCLFCGIGKGSVETFKVYEDAGIVAFLDITPAVAGQVIIIPKEHYQFIFQMPDQLLWDIVRIMKFLMPIIVNATKAQGISVYMAQGPAAGQRVGHVALNLVPRFSGDKAVFAWDRKEVHKEDLEKAAKEIRLSLDKTFAEEKEKISKKIREQMASRPSILPTPKPENLPEFPRRRA